MKYQSAVPTNSQWGRAEKRQDQADLICSMRQLETIFNNIDSLIHVTDMKSYKILYMNKSMKEQLQEDMTGKICWQTFQTNQDGPCDFCTNDKLIDANGNPTEPYVWEFYNPKFCRWYELHDLATPWIDGNLVRIEIATDITGRKVFEQKQKQNKKILEKKVKERTIELEEMNATLKTLLKKREEDKKEIEEKIFLNFKLLISPTIDSLKKSITQKQQQEMLNILESEFKHIISPFSKKLSDKMINLTPTEIHIADLIKFGKSNKEISKILNKSVHTIYRHRENIRKKTNLINKKTNLRSFLLALE